MIIELRMNLWMDPGTIRSLKSLAVRSLVACGVIMNQSDPSAARSDSTNQMPVTRSGDHSRPIRRQYPSVARVDLD